MMAAGVAMPEIKTAGPSPALLDRKEVSFETSIRPEDKVRKGRGLVGSLGYCYCNCWVLDYLII